MARRRAAILLVTALAFSALAAATAQSAKGGLIGTGAASGCDSAASHPFEAWGDSASYLLVPGGSFERIGVLTVLDGGSVPANGQWQPSPRIGMLVCNVTSLVGTKAVALRFRAVNAAFQIDDVYIDPWKDF